MSKILGPDGVQQIYPTKAGGTEFFLNQADPYQGGAYTSRSDAQFNISYGTGSQFPFTTHKEGNLTFFNTTGSPITYASGGKPGRSVRLDVYPDGGKWKNSTNFSWVSNPGYLYTANSIGSQEFTSFVRVHGDLGSHQSYAHKIGGRDEDAIRSLFEMVYPTATHSDIQCNYNYAHFPYVNVKPVHTIPNPPQLADNGKWIGVKTVHKIAPDRKSSDWEMWVDVDPFDASGKPNNGWVLAATYHDVGTSGYNNIPLTWMCQKDLCRIDGFASVDFTLLSDREIDFSGAPPPPPPPPPPICPPGQHLDPQTNICVPDVVPPLSTRSQSRTTTTAGEPVPDQFWTITADTGPLVGPSPIPGNLPITAVTALGAEAGNPATQAIDGNLATRWSNLGAGSWIQLDLGILCDLTEVDIAWYLGDTRTNNFAIDLSADRKTFKNVLTSVSDGKSLALESYKLTGQASLVKITVNGNSSNQWASITEIAIKGAPATPIPTPTGVQAVITPPSQTTPPGHVITLNGSQSKGDITAYQWTQTAGSQVSILNATLAIASFIAPEITIPSQPAPSSMTLGFALRVTDKSGQTSTANAIVTVQGPIVPPSCPPGQHVDPVTNLCVPDVVVPPTSVDTFGVKKVYGDGPGSVYFMTSDPSSDPRGNNPEASSSFKPKYIKNGDGSFKIKGQIEIRGAITQDNGFNQSKMCTDFTKCRQQGFMQDSMDWKDIEMTSYYRINQTGSSASNGESHIEHVMRGQRSTTSNSTFGGPCSCALGCSDNYHANIYCNKGKNGAARQKYEKDLFHTTGYSTDIAGVNNNSAYNFKLGAWFGIKTVCYNLADGSVQLEHWTDENATNNWVKTHSFVDHDQWPPRGLVGNCNIPSSKSGSPPITFGGPLTVFRSDNITDYDVKWQSIRSIDSTKKLMGTEHLVSYVRNPGVTDKTVIEEDQIYQGLEG